MASARPETKIKMKKSKKRSKSLLWWEATWAYVMISPWLVGFIALKLGPMLVSLYYSFTDYEIITPPVWVGLSNFIVLSRDPVFWQSLWVTLRFSILSLPLQLLFGFLLAVMLNQKIPGVKVLRTIYYLPATITGVATALIWGLILNPNQGLLNPFLAIFGITGPAWLQDPRTALYALVIISLWGVGGGVVIYLAGLQGIPTELYEAARVDGANVLQQFLRITIPMMTPVIFYNLVLGLINSFQYFNEPYILTRGGPVRATTVYNLYLFQNAFYYNHMGYASAMAWILFLITLFITLLVFRSSDSWVYYEGKMR